MLSTYPQGIQDVGDFISSVEESLAQTDRFMSDFNVSSGAAGFYLNLSVHVLFALKDSVPID